MIIECENCQSKFNLDVALIKKEGSKVRCSVCRSVFTIYSSQPEIDDEHAMDHDLDDELEETVSLDSPPVFDQEEGEFFASDEVTATDFDQAFRKAMEEGIEEPVIGEAGGDEDTLPGKDLGRAKKIEEYFTGEDVDREEKEMEGEEPPTAVSDMEKSRASKSLLIILFIILFLIVASGAVYFFFSDYLPGFLSSQKPVPVETSTDMGIKNLTFKDVSGSFIESESAGQRFVVKGKVLNNYPDPRSYVLVKAEILDEKGLVIRTKLAYTGNVFTENEIKKMPMEEIDMILKNRLGRNQMNLNIPSMSDVPFMVIFENLPHNLSEFSVEAVSSSPGE